MSIFAIGDLHLPGGDKKPMDVFGSHWEHHFERICADWRSRVKPEDIVLIPGDISWAMQLGDALSDLRDIAKLPGTILLLRGNHDFWWSSLSQLRACLPENMHAVQNDAFDAGTCVFCGTRGWTIPLGQNATAQDEKLYRREAAAEMSLKDAARIANGRRFCNDALSAAAAGNGASGTEFTRLLSEYGVKRCV
ncbi:MAG: metallophosphoesterase [Christensenellales bacterium]